MMATERTAGRVLLLKEGDTPYAELDGVPGMELGRVITTPATTSLGGGFSRFTGEAVLADWTLRYDEVFYVIEGELVIESGQETVRGGSGTKAFFVLHPRDWAERSGE